MGAIGTALGLPFARPNAGFSPLSLAPLIHTSARLLGLSDGASVPSMANAGSVSGSYAQANGTKQPVFDADGINGLPSVNSDGVDDIMVFPAFGSYATWWGFMVFRTVATVPASKELWAVQSFPEGNPGKFILLETSGANTLRVNTTWAPSVSPSTLALANNTAYALLVAGSTTSWRMKLSSGAEQTGTLAGTSSNQAEIFNFPMTIFGRNDGALFMSYRFGEQTVGSGTLSASDEANLWAYANRVWGTPIP